RRRRRRARRPRRLLRRPGLQRLARAFPDVVARPPPGASRGLPVARRGGRARRRRRDTGPLAAGARLAAGGLAGGPGALAARPRRGGTGGARRASLEGCALAVAQLG